MEHVAREEEPLVRQIERPLVLDDLPECVVDRVAVDGSLQRQPRSPIGIEQGVREQLVCPVRPTDDHRTLAVGRRPEAERIAVGRIFDLIEVEVEGGVEADAVGPQIDVVGDAGGREGVLREVEAVHLEAEIAGGRVDGGPDDTVDIDRRKTAGGSANS